MVLELGYVHLGALAKCLQATNVVRMLNLNITEVNPAYR